jgi:hypothetical protein
MGVDGVVQAGVRLDPLSDALDEVVDLTLERVVSDQSAVRQDRRKRGPVQHPRQLPAVEARRLMQIERE